MATPFDRITWNPKQMNGQPCIRGMRLTVRRFVEAVALYPNQEDLFRSRKISARRWPSRQPISKTKLKYPRLERPFVDASIRFLIDQGVPRDAASLLRTAGLSCDHAGEIGMSKAEDPYIIEWARAHDGVVITLDADFHAELAVSGA